MIIRKCRIKVAGNT